MLTKVTKLLVVLLTIFAASFAESSETEALLGLIIGNNKANTFISPKMAKLTQWEEEEKGTDWDPEEEVHQFSLVF